MIPNSRLEKAINGLQELVQRHKKQDKIKISRSSITLEAGGSQFWGTIFYVSIMLVLPAGLLVCYLLTDDTNTIILWLLLLEILFGLNLCKMVVGNTIFSIDFATKQFRVENINGVFKRWFKPKIMSFCELSEVQLKERLVGSNKTTWLQLSGMDKQNNKIVFTDMGSDYPESFIAEKVKFLLDVIIWTQKQNKVHEAGDA